MSGAGLNGIAPVLRAIDRFPDRPALIFPGLEPVTFGSLEKTAVRFQQSLKSLGLSQGDVVLLGEAPSPLLYSFVLAALGLGISVAVVEPWMPLSKIETVIDGLKPKLFLTGMLGRLWGYRARNIRAIPEWRSLASLLAIPVGAMSGATLESKSLPAYHLGLVAFTSGTTGRPKGVPRRHGYLLSQHLVLSRALHHDQHEGPELTIFTNFVFANLASARGSVVIPSAWKPDHLRWAGALTSNGLAPESATVGPAFLRRLAVESGFEKLHSIHVGGALTDRAIFEAAFGRFRDSEFLHVYGSSEAEPVAVMDAKEAVERSRSRGLYQTLALGKPIQDIEHRIELSTVWVTGPHVCPLYIGRPEDVEIENQASKRQGQDGRVWHAMGDRIVERDGVWWYAGRSSQSESDFQTEQDLAREIESSKVFIDRTSDSHLNVYCEGEPERFEKVAHVLREMRSERPSIGAFSIFKTQIVRDHRHRARIDRVKSIKKATLVSTPSIKR